jgi:hypothetical protein
MLPHGYFLVIAPSRGLGRPRPELLELLTLRLAENPVLLGFTERQLRSYARYVKKPTFEIINGFPCELTVNDVQEMPLRLITEYPDETIWGEAFRQGHAAQMETVLAAYDIYQTLRSGA